MITHDKFQEIETEVERCIYSILDKIKNTSPKNYCLLLANGEYNEFPNNDIHKFNPHVIDDNSWDKITNTRTKFLTNFLNTFYAFPDEQSVEDDEIRMHIELMIYSHIWESKSFLKQLYRLAHILFENKYVWNVSIPDFRKHDFIRDDIQKSFESQEHTMFQIIKNGFHSSLRNAFAHSEYYFMGTNIHLTNYKGREWEIQDITFSDWSIRFVYSVLLSYNLIKYINVCRKNIIQDLGTNIFVIDLPSSKGVIREEKIVYNKNTDMFSFERNVVDTWEAVDNWCKE
ncbi:hypothetical protein FACS189456_3860 [Bacteroidia bacterium]|nr:hypothetical protein FACS189456_3860 [Bacteroidia bacterium]